MQGELEAAGHGAVILGINAAALEDGNDAFCEGRDLPWLQDLADTDVWASWAIEYRDVVVVDAEGRPTATFNLTEQDLSESDTFDELFSLLTDER